MSWGLAKMAKPAIKYRIDTHIPRGSGDAEYRIMTGTGKIAATVDPMMVLKDPFATAKALALGANFLPATVAALKIAEEWMAAMLAEEPEDYDNRRLKRDLRTVRQAIAHAEPTPLWRVEVNYQTQTSGNTARFLVRAKNEDAATDEAHRQLCADRRRVVVKIDGGSVERAEG